ncbi:extracellular solute-binding protein [bacterium]|nr:extracellular solute-binding protein [bacterium]
MLRNKGVWGWLVLALMVSGVFWIWSSPDFRASRKIPLNFWTGFTGPDGERMVDLIREFHRQNPDVEVSLQRIDWGVYYNKLFVAGLGGRSPEVFVLHAGMMPRFASAGLMAEMDELLDTQSRAALDDLVPVIRPKLQWEGHQVAWPLDVHMLGLYCNLNLFRKAGWVDAVGHPKIPRNRAEFLEAGAALRKLSTPSREIWGFGIADPNLIALTSCYQFGGRLMSQDLLQPVLDSPENVRGLDFLRELVGKYHVAPPPESNDAWIGFRQGNIGMVMAGIWMLADVKGDHAFDFDVQPLPQLGNQAASFGSTHLMGLAPGLSDESREAGWRLIQFLSAHSLEWAKVGQLPARQSLLSSAEFRSLLPQANLASEIPHLVFTPGIPSLWEVQDEFYRAGEKVLRGTEPASTSLRLAQRKAEAVLERSRNRHSFAQGNR